MTRAVLCGGLAALALAAPASAHVTIAPSSSRPADLQRYRLLVPNESTSRATVGVVMQLPPGVTFALANAQPPWRAKLVRGGGQIREIHWTGGRIPVDGYGELYFLARNPVKEGAATFKTLQRYEGGQIARWIGTPESDNPSPAVTLSEKAVPVDVVSVHGEKPDAAPATAAPAPAAQRVAAATNDDDGGSTATIAFIAALIALAVSIGAALWTRSARGAGRGGS